MCKVKLFRRDDGKTDVVVYRTRHTENPTRMVAGVAPDKVVETASLLIKEVKGADSPAP